MRILLPLGAGAAAAEDANAPPQPDAAEPGEAVLLVDDELAAREAVAERLRELGYRVWRRPTAPQRCTCSMVARGSICWSPTSGCQTG